MNSGDEIQLRDAISDARKAQKCSEDEIDAPMHIAFFCCTRLLHSLKDINELSFQITTTLGHDSGVQLLSEKQHF